MSEKSRRIVEENSIPLAGSGVEKMVDDRPESNPHTMLGRAEFRKRLEHVLKNLSPRKERVIRMLYGLAPYEREYSEEEIAQNFKETLHTNIDAEEIKKIKASALRELRQTQNTVWLRGSTGYDVSI